MKNDKNRVSGFQTDTLFAIYFVSNESNRAAAPLENLMIEDGWKRILLFQKVQQRSPDTSFWHFYAKIIGNSSADYRKTGLIRKFSGTFHGW